MAERPHKPLSLPTTPRPAVATAASGQRPPGTGTGRPRPPAAGAANPAPAAALPAGSPAAGGVRISKLMAERGLCSRRDADQYIARGWVFVDGRRVSELGTRADPAAVITLDRQAQANQQSRLTILLHKPIGYVSGQPEPGFTPAVTLIQPERQCTYARTRRFFIPRA
jgi:23S rRNA pseudouridine2604 synthase